jgi:hypothetical protein
LGTGFSYITLRGRWFGITVLNVHAPTEAKSDDTDVLRRTAVCTGSIPKYHTKILLGDFNVKLRREDIFKPTVGNKSLHESSNDNGVRVGSRVRFPAGAGNFSLHHRVQNGSGAYPASYPMGTMGSFLGGKAAGT